MLHLSERITQRLRQFQRVESEPCLVAFV
jgi:hypothetical protein